MADVFRGIGAVVSTQVLSRALTFILNVLVARLASPSAYGVGYVSLQLLSNLVLFFAKEGFRKVALRTSAEDDLGLQSSANLGWMGTASAAVLAVPLATHWFRSDPSSAVGYQGAVLLVAFASVLEGLAEPFVVLTLAAQKFERRALGEAGAILARTIGMLLFTLALDDVPLAFASSQMIYALVWLGWIAWPFLWQKDSTWKPAGTKEGLVSKHHQTLFWEFAGMVMLKLGLTEGEKILLMVLFNAQQWGVFGLVSNLGSIVLRLLFAPIEEIAYSVFSAASLDPEKPESRKAQVSLLRALLLLQGGVGWLGLCFGPSFSETAVRILYGQEWAASEAPVVLAAYCAFLFFASLNGIFEAFMYSQCSPAWVRQCNFWQVGISLVLLLVSWVGQSAGPIALVLANSLAMLLRAALGCIFAYRHLQPSWTELRLGPVGQLFCLLALGSRVTAMLVSPVMGPRQIVLAVSSAVIAIATAGLLCKGELAATLRAIRRGKQT